MQRDDPSGAGHATAVERRLGAGPGGNSGRSACPNPEGLAGTAGTLPTFTMIRSAGSAPS